MSTHIEAKKGDIAKTVLMPGDPLRAKFIAENYLEDVICYNDVRNMFGYTGFYKGKRVSVQGSGMGAPSIGIYSYELFSEYDVESIIRVGTAGAISDKVDIRDIVIAQGACTNSNFAYQYRLPGVYAPIADYSLLRKAVECADKMGVKYEVGNVFTSDMFYDDSMSLSEWRKMNNVLAVEMETAALYLNAARLDKKALTICTISDCPFKNTETTADEREKSFTQMMLLALETAVGE